MTDILITSQQCWEYLNPLEKKMDSKCSYRYNGNCTEAIPLQKQKWCMNQEHAAN